VFKITIVDYRQGPHTEPHQTSYSTKIDQVAAIDALVAAAQALGGDLRTCTEPIAAQCQGTPIKIFDLIDSAGVATAHICTD